MDRRLAALVIIASTAYLFAAFLISEPGGQYAAVGPRAFPIAIGFGLVACSVWIGMTGAVAREQRAQPTIDWRSASLSALVVLAYLGLFETAGFMLATVAFITLQSRVLGSRALVRDLVVSVVIAVSVYAVFQLLLGVRLPAGLLG